MNIGPVHVMRTIARQPWERVLFLASIVCGVGYLLTPFLRADLAQYLMTFGFVLTKTQQGVATTIAAV